MMSRQPTNNEYMDLYNQIVTEFPEIADTATLSQIKDDYITHIYGTSTEAKGCTVFFIVNKVLFELILYVCPEHRGNVRLPIQMIADMRNIAKEHNCTEIRTGSSLGHAEAMQKLYKRAGYTTTDIRMKLCVENC